MECHRQGFAPSMWGVRPSNTNSDGWILSYGSGTYRATVSSCFSTIDSIQVSMPSQLIWVLKPSKVYLYHRPRIQCEIFYGSKFVICGGGEGDPGTTKKAVCSSSDGSLSIGLCTNYPRQAQRPCQCVVR